MRRIVPSQVVELIKGIGGQEVRNGVVLLNNVGAPALSSTIRLVGQIPDELLTMDGESYASFLRALEQIRDVLDTWRANRTAGNHLDQITFGEYQSPLSVIRETLSKCPDESPEPSSAELGFISDTDLRLSLRNDLGSIDRALSSGEWKASTILAGSVVEALLLDALLRCPLKEVTDAANDLATSGILEKKPGSNLERWNLHEYTEVAARLSIIKDDATSQTRLAKEFRNLIHPGRTQRLGKRCDRATALSAVAAVQHVIRDLTPKS